VLPPVVSCAASSWNLPAPSAVPSAVPWGISHWEMVISPGKPEENHRKLWENHGDLKNDGLSVD